MKCTMWNIVEHFGFWIDVEIFFRTIAVAFSREGVGDTAVKRIGAEIIDDRQTKECKR